MTIQLHWWYLPLILFLVPLIFSAVRRPQYGGDYGMDVIPLLVYGFCWTAAAFLLLGRAFS